MRTVAEFRYDPRIDRFQLRSFPRGFGTVSTVSLATETRADAAVNLPPRATAPHLPRQLSDLEFVVLRGAGPNRRVAAGEVTACRTNCSARANISANWRFLSATTRAWPPPSRTRRARCV
jgi:hypothetical protein